LILTGGIEENGLYLTTGKHNNVLRATGDAIARSLGNALAAPIVTLEPGNPERVRTPGTVLLSPETYRAVLTDMAVSLKTQGFTDTSCSATAAATSSRCRKWPRRSTRTGRAAARPPTSCPNIPTTTRSRRSKKVLGIHEKMEGLHDDNHISSIIMVHDVNGVRAPERIEAGKFTINGVSLAPVEKTIETNAGS
jgi:creatinine amidohydrolase